MLTIPAISTDLLEAVYSNIVDTYLPLVPDLMELLVINIPLEMPLEMCGKGGNVLVFQQINQAFQVNWVWIMRLEGKI